MGNTTQRVTRRPDGKWQHKQDGNQRATKVTDTQQEAIKSAVDMAKRLGGEVIIQGEDGKIRSRDSYGKDTNPPQGDPFRYDVTVSFAGEDRPTVDRLVRLLRRHGVRVFYDAWEQADLWGKDLYQHLDEIYRSEARYCLIFVSEHYVKKAWTKHELRSAQARAFKENSEYILPIRLDEAELPGLPPTIAYLDARKIPLAEICQMFVSKLGLKREIESVAECSWSSRGGA